MAIYNKTVTKLFTILKKRFLPNLNPATYLKLVKRTGVCVCVSLSCHIAFYTNKNYPVDVNIQILFN